MKLRLIPLSILLVVSMAACEKNAPSTSVGVNPNAPVPKDSTVKIHDNRWNWGGVPPFSYKFEGSFVKSEQSGSMHKTATYPDGNSILTLYSNSENDNTENYDTLMMLWIPNKISEMQVGQEYTIPVPNGGAMIWAPIVHNDPEIKSKFIMHPNDGGNIRVKITSITNTEIEGKFYGVVKQRPEHKSSSGLGWAKIEEGYFKFDLKDTAIGM